MSLSGIQLQESVSAQFKQAFSASCKKQGGNEEGSHSGAFERIS